MTGKVTANYRRDHPFDRERTVLERRFDFPLDPEGRVRVQGVVDWPSITPDGAWEIRASIPAGKTRARA